ncbi:uncharacterized protein I303_102870 [Kwoniella dejecticola CBS 10117]|uniref:DUF1688-domain-containing protein n=1 Tax=Kwoniella dejecticola CBS 10117 TaxID=1296121 RepID=A0A1A6A9Y7_9TREE|nr:uncharacterized protein I303_02889 [Kwoniella dejecticola CBS 10117]OBR86869.1 hypothetical protein I303_02889 [Kwoniella dejecticola CBS 10117]
MSAPIVTYLRSLEAIRDRSSQVYELGKKGKLDHWEFDEEKLDGVVDYCINIIKRDFGSDYAKIPPHCRRNHFLSPDNDRISNLLSRPDFPGADGSGPLERAKALIDLYLVSVLLDAGAGPKWSYTETDVQGEISWKGGRSEGLAIASYHMFISGLFSSDKARKYQVDATGLRDLTPETLAKHLQISPENPMDGLEGRCNLLIKLGDALKSRQDICQSGRPGDILDFFSNRITDTTLPLSAFWTTLFELLLPIWPSRTTLPSHPTEALGDVWPCPSLSRSLDEAGVKRTEGDDYVVFHKLTQWLCYSLVEAIESQTEWKVQGKGQTGLPEYRNGGLLVDLGVLTIKPPSLGLQAYPNGEEQPPVLEPSHPAVIEWRSMTVICLDEIHELICAKLGVSTAELTLAQVLEAATWKGGREIAKEKRAGGGPPVEIISDGTVF